MRTEAQLLTRILLRLTRSLVDQTNDFLNYNAPGKAYYPGWSSSNTLFSVWIGINDIGNSYWRSDATTFDDTLLNRYFQLVQSLYSVGARKFLFLTVPPIQRSPLMLGQGSSVTATEKAVIADYNSKLAAKAAAFASANSGVTALVYDTSTAFNTVLDNPSAYGLQDATSYGSGNTYAWCNDYHPSPVIHNALASDLSKLIKGTYI
ncbi:related to cellulose-binding GDSL lipase/acylhydrolase, putative-Aspergillus fumigatus [Serendipita indica DSM 11827]|uniref:Related to cellulose-binding GDSL lipase/acylhydrolase, putative-Aspergillus fumigatus n=1 Tax=Serendipita indica (strain DSM 11827) TaxID=1109443 RepID=G4TPY4_SERID|nr:related to cellulose-binding GDSL lipase/acylhydrolase, putative-Aspergillus fumigatus [Serendipita indica DSM 11827]